MHKNNISSIQHNLKRNGAYFYHASTNLSSLATSKSNDAITPPSLMTSPKLEKTEEYIKSKNHNTIPSSTLSSSNAMQDARLMTDMTWLKSIAYNNGNKTTALSLSKLYKYTLNTPNIHNQRIRNAQFLHRELQVRVADRALDLLTLPNRLSSTRAIKDVAFKYIQLLKQITECPVPKTIEEERHFTVVVSEMVLDRTSIPHGIAKGMQSLKDKRREKLLDSARLQQVEDALYRFFTARVGLRFLMEHHILTADTPQATLLRKQHTCHLDDECTLSPPKYLDNHQYVGVIENNCNPVLEIEQVVKQVTRSCISSHGIAPPIELIDCTSSSNTPFCYVPHHLRYMVAELLKNSCRATIRHHLNTSQKMDPIKIIIVKGKEDVTIKIADRGGGISRSKLRDVWTFTKSTLNTTHDDFHAAADDIREFGLPLARIYARYFGGDITLKSCEGVGLDAYLYLPVLGDSCENLPEQVATSPGNLDSNTLSHYNDGDDIQIEKVDTNSNSHHWKSIDELCQRAL